MVSRRCTTYPVLMRGSSLRNAGRQRVAIETLIDSVGQHLELLEVQAQRFKIALRQAVAFPSQGIGLRLELFQRPRVPAGARQAKVGPIR